MIKPKQVIILSLVIVFIPLAFFGFYFYDQKISTNVDDWASFSTFLSLIVAVLSLLLISYITYLISDESLKKPKKWEAYEAFLDVLETTSKISDEFVILNVKLQYVLEVFKNSSGNGDTKNLEQQGLASLLQNKGIDYNTFISEADLALRPYREVYYFLYHMQNRYRHLLPKHFFDKKEFENYINLCEKLKDFSVNLSFNLTKKTYDYKFSPDIDLPLDEIHDFHFKSEEFCVFLKKSLKIPLDHSTPEQL